MSIHKPSRRLSSVAAAYPDSDEHGLVFLTRITGSHRYWSYAGLVLHTGSHGLSAGKAKAKVIGMVKFW